VSELILLTSHIGLQHVGLELTSDRCPSQIHSTSLLSTTSLFTKADLSISSWYCPGSVSKLSDNQLVDSCRCHLPASNTSVANCMLSAECIDRWSVDSGNPKATPNLPITRCHSTSNLAWLSKVNKIFLIICRPEP
jgi:hypothetical protein